MINVDGNLIKAHRSTLSRCADLNRLDNEICGLIQNVLNRQQISEYSTVVKILNQELCEPTLFFTVDIESLPELNWSEGTQSMSLKCVKHHKGLEPKGKYKKKKKQE